MLSLYPRRQIARAAAAALLFAFAADARAADGERVIVCLGDSLTEGYGLAPEHACRRWSSGCCASAVTARAS